jgi:DNA-binding transcriptional MerR regulator
MSNNKDVEQKKVEKKRGLLTMKIQEVAAQTGLGIHALRYYEQIGLITPITRKDNGHRTYSQDDVYRLNFITRLCSTGMPIAEIKRYNDLAAQGEATVLERMQILEAHKAMVEQKIAELRTHLELIDGKIAHYKELHEAQLVRER